MGKLNDEQIDRIQTYHQDFSNNEIAKDMGINRKTVAKYRQMKAATQQQAMDALSGKEEQMRFKQKQQGKNPLSKEEKKKLDLLEHYSPKDIRDMLNYIATNNKKEIDKVIGEPGHLKFGLVSDTHFGSKMAARDELGEFYEKAKDKGVEAFVHCGDIVDGCDVYQGQQFEQDKVGFEEQLADIKDNYPNVGLPTYFVGGNHDEKFLKQNGVNICKAIETVRQDLINLGFYDAKLKLNGITIQLHHGGGSIGYSRDYKLNRMLDGLPTQDQPDIFALGHFHNSLYSLHRGIHGFLPGARLKENLLCKRFNLGNEIGGRVIDVEKDEKGKTFLNMEFIKF